MYKKNVDLKKRAVVETCFWNGFVVQQMIFFASFEYLYNWLSDGKLKKWYRYCVSWYFEINNRCIIMFILIENYHFFYEFQLSFSIY